MEITKTLKEKFCKDNAIGIKIFDEPYFSDRLALYDRVMTESKISEKYDYVRHLQTFYRPQIEGWNHSAAFGGAALALSGWIYQYAHPYGAV